MPRKRVKRTKADVTAKMSISSTDESTLTGNARLQEILSEFQNHFGSMDNLLSDAMCKEARKYLDGASDENLFSIYYFSCASDIRLLRHDSASEFGRKALEVAEKNQNPLNLALIYRQLGWNDVVRNSYDAAKVHLDVALTWILKTPNRDIEGKIYYNFATLAIKKGDQNEAVEFGLRALQIAESQGHRREVALTSHLLAGALGNLKRIDDAEKFEQVALNIGLEQEDWANVARAYNGLYVLELGRNATKAYSYALEAYQASSRTTALSIKRIVLCNLCDVTRLLELPAEREFANELRTFADEHKDDFALLHAEFVLGKIALSDNDPEMAVKHFEIMLGLYQYAQEDQLFCMPESAAEAYEKIGDFENALKWKKKQSEVEREMLNNKHLAIARYERLMREQSEMHTKEVAEMELNQKNRELGISTLQLIAQTELLTELRNDLLQVIRKFPMPDAAAKELRDRLKTLPCKSVDWERFDTQFKAAHPEFTKTLLERFPVLTPMQVRVCSLIRMNLKSEEIGRLLCLTERNIENHRYRIRKKLALKREEDLAIYLAKL